MKKGSAEEAIASDRKHRRCNSFVFCPREAFYRAFSGRIRSLARTQALLSDDYWQTAPLRDLLVHKLQPYTVEDRMRSP